MIGLNSVIVTPTDGTDPVDISCLVDTLAIKHGRDDVDSQPEASTATLDLSFDTSDEDLPPAVEVGSTLETEIVLAGVHTPRFVGTITDIAIGWDDQGEDTPNAAVVQIIASGPLAAAGRTVVGDVPWTQELDGSRVSRIFDAAGFPLSPATSDPGTVQILARDVDAQPALGLAQEVAQSASGIVWETRTGEIRYADSSHRRRTTASLDLDACDVLVSPTWKRDTQGIVNDVSIGYGVAPEGGEQPRYLDSRPTSIDRYGTYAISTSTQLAALADAQAMGTLLLTRNSSPVWLLVELPVDVAALDLVRTNELLALDMHDLIGFTGMPIVGTLPSTTALWIEGWSETLAYGSHDLTLFVSGFCRTVPPPRWDDVAPSMTWDTIGTLTWDDAACLGPLPSYGRWADVPASLRWDRVDPSITWDTWTG